MANIKLKDVNKLELWNGKELRKLRMVIKNRICSLTESSNPKALPANHPLFEMESGECKQLLKKVETAEKKLNLA